MFELIYKLKHNIKMKNYIYTLGVAALTLSIVSCGSVDYPKADKEVAKQACSCFGDLAKQSTDIHNWYAEHSEEIQKLKDKLEDPDATIDSELPKQFEDMTEKWNQTREKALNVCYEDFIDEKGDYYEERFHKGQDDAKTILIPELAKDLCPEVAAPLAGLSDHYSAMKELLPQED